mgnify:CR=1 FL=1
MSFLRRIYTFNSEFAVEPENSDSVFRKPDDSINLDYVFSIREKRVIDAGGVFSYRNKTFKVEDGAYAGKLPAKTKITVLLNPDIGEIGIKAMYKGMLFDVSRYLPEKRKKKAVPKKDHPRMSDSAWMQFKPIYSAFDKTISDREVMEMLEDAFLK